MLDLLAQCFTSIRARGNPAKQTEVFPALTAIAEEKSSKKAGRDPSGMCFVTTATSSAEVSRPGVADTSASCLAVSSGKAVSCTPTKTPVKRLNGYNGKKSKRKTNKRARYRGMKQEVPVKSWDRASAGRGRTRGRRSRPSSSAAILRCC